MSPNAPLAAALFDFGGVLTSSPFEAFAAYEDRRGLPQGFIRRVNATNHHDNAWARLERNEVTVEEFCPLFEAEAEALGHHVDAREVLGLLAGDLRPEMVEAVRRCAVRLKTGCLTNNFRSAMEARPEIAEVLSIFDVVVASSEVGVRKPDPRFYKLACERLGVEPSQAIFLDDLGVNLKPAKAMGMRTIKVTSVEEALGALEQAVGFRLR